MKCKKIQQNPIERHKNNEDPSSECKDMAGKNKRRNKQISGVKQRAYHFTATAAARDIQSTSYLRWDICYGNKC